VLRVEKMDGADEDRHVVCSSLASEDVEERRSASQEESAGSDPNSKRQKIEDTRPG